MVSSFDTLPSMDSSIDDTDMLRSDLSSFIDMPQSFDKKL